MNNEQRTMDDGRAAGAVCFLSETYYPTAGGTQTQMRIVSSDLVVAGFSVIAVTRRSTKELAAVEDVDGTTVYRVSPVGPGQGKRWRLLFTAFFKLIALRKEYDVIYVNGFRVLGISAVLAAKLCRKRCVLRAVSTGEMSGEFFSAGLARKGLSLSSFPVRLFLGIRNSLLRRADAIIAMTSDIESELKQAGVAENRIRRIPNCVDTGSYEPASGEGMEELRKNLLLPADARIAVYTGRLVSYKGLPVLLRSWKKVRERNDKALLLLVGGEGNDLENCEPELKSFVAENKLEDAVRFTGQVNNVNEYLRASDVFVLPTESEVFSNSLIEAMACGLPVVVTPVGGSKDIITDGEDGLLIETGDVDGIADALNRLIGDPAFAEKMAAASLKTVRDRYSREAVKTRYVELFSRRES